MVNICPTPEPAGKYTMAQASKMLGIHRNTLLRYTKEGAIRCEYDGKNMRKLFNGLEIIKFWSKTL